MAKIQEPPNLNPAGPVWNNPRVISNHKARQRRDLAIRVLVVLCVFAVLIPLGDMLYMFVVRGIELTTLPRLTGTPISSTPGLSNALVGTALITGLSALIAVPVGIFGGVYMSEFSRGGPFTEGVRFAADVLAGVPSIVVGYVCFLAFVLFFGFGYSALAAGIALSILMFPYIIRTTELAIKKVPNNIKEGAIALGSTKTTMINRLVLRFALPGILTGVMLAIGIALSETAPLLYTAQFANYNPTGIIHSPVAYLTGVIWTFYQSPIPSDQQLAYVAAFLLIVIVLVLNVIARVGLQRISKI